MKATTFYTIHSIVAVGIIAFSSGMLYIAKREPQIPITVMSLIFSAGLTAGAYTLARIGVNSDSGGVFVRYVMGAMGIKLMLNLLFMLMLILLLPQKVDFAFVSIYFFAYFCFTFFEFFALLNNLRTDSKDRSK